MIGRLVVVAAGIVAAAAAVAAWNKRQADEELALQAELDPSVDLEVIEGTPQPVDVPEVAATGGSATGHDELQAIKGIGKVSEGRLNEIGITRFDQIAAWSPADTRKIAELIRVSPERIEREEWVGQARAITGD